MLKNICYKTPYGTLLKGDSYEILTSENMNFYKGKITLIITSPPFPLNTKKKYGNLVGSEYKDWLIAFAPVFEELLRDDGSVVIELGNSWEHGRPVQSLLHLESLLGFVNNSNLRLIQEFISYNPSKLPSPAQWVTKERIRTVDSYTHIWWMSKSDYPKADNRKVLRPYSKSMKKLLKNKTYNSGIRPSEHQISKEGFLKDNNGSIAHNFFEIDPIDEKRDVRLPYNVLSFSNTSSNDFFLKNCREYGFSPHPARMNKGIISFFINFLTEKNDIVLDPFAGSNTTGYVSEVNKRNWISIEIDDNYINQSVIRFHDPDLKTDIKLFDQICNFG